MQRKESVSQPFPSMKENPIYRDLHKSGLSDVECSFYPDSLQEKKAWSVIFVFFVYWVNVFSFFLRLIFHRPTICSWIKDKGSSIPKSETSFKS